MTFDPWGLGYTVERGQFFVHYPKRDVTGALAYGPGMAFDHRPEIALYPDSERSALWRAMETRHND